MNFTGLAALACCAIALCGCHQRGAGAVNATSATAAATPAMRAYIDPATGRLGPAPATTASSQGAPSAQAQVQVQSTARVPAPVFRTRADGTVEMNLNRKQQIRATRDPDGTLHQQESAVTGAGPRP